MVTPTVCPDTTVSTLRGERAYKTVHHFLAKVSNYKVTSLPMTLVIALDSRLEKSENAALFLSERLLFVTPQLEQINSACPSCRCHTAAHLAAIQHVPLTWGWLG